jgi:hypothetical protein
LILGGIVDEHCLEMIVRFVDIDGIVDQHCLEIIVGIVDIGGIVNRNVEICCHFPFHFITLIDYLTSRLPVKFKMVLLTDYFY